MTAQLWLQSWKSKPVGPKNKLISNTSDYLSKLWVQLSDLVLVITAELLRMILSIRASCHIHMCTQKHTGVSPHMQDHAHTYVYHTYRRGTKRMSYKCRIGGMEVDWLWCPVKFRTVVAIFMCKSEPEQSGFLTSIRMLRTQISQGLCT